MKIVTSCLFASCFLGLAACGGSGTVSGPGPGGASLCEATCPKTCALDSDCNSSNGQICCNYGSYGHACQDASKCPHLCSSSTQCNTANGEACCLTSPFSRQMECATTDQCLVPCSTDSQCENDDAGICIKFIEQPVCASPASSRATCSSSSSCSADFPVCCTTLSLVDTGLVASGTGLCLAESGTETDPVFGTCPTACKMDSDCSAPNPICCNGLCASACAPICKSDSDCAGSSSGQICCGNAAIASPFWD